MVQFKTKKGTQIFIEVYNIMENPEGIFFTPSLCFHLRKFKTLRIDSEMKIFLKVICTNIYYSCILYTIFNNPMLPVHKEIAMCSILIP